MAVNPDQPAPDLWKARPDPARPDHSDDVPALDLISLSSDPDVLYAGATSALEDPVAHGVDALQVELVLGMLLHARDLDMP